MINGFIYLWRDSKRRMFYIGSHAGDPDDGYISGSKSMRRAYAVRPHTFKRRIIKFLCVPDRPSLYAEEQQWLDLLGPKLGTLYYNINPKAYGADPALASAWMMGNKNAAGRPCSPETRRKISEAQKGKIIPMESREKMRLAKLGVKRSPDSVRKRMDTIAAKGPIRRSPDISARIGDTKRRNNAKKRDALGYVHSPETRRKISASQKIRLAKQKVQDL